MNLWRKRWRTWFVAQIQVRGGEDPASSRNRRRSKDQANPSGSFWCDAGISSQCEVLQIKWHKVQTGWRWSAFWRQSKRWNCKRFCVMRYQVVTLISPRASNDIIRTWRFGPADLIWSKFYPEALNSSVKAMLTGVAATQRGVGKSLTRIWVTISGYERCLPRRDHPILMRVHRGNWVWRSAASTLRSRSSRQDSLATDGGLKNRSRCVKLPFLERKVLVSVRRRWLHGV